MKKIAFITPSGFLSEHHKKNVHENKKVLEKLGFKVIFGKHIFAEKNYLAGTDKERAQDIMSAYKDKDVVAIIATRGGFGGCASLLPHLDFKIIKKNPKPFIGFSDVTSIQNAIYQKTKQKSLSGFMAGYEMLKNTKNSLESLINNKNFEISSGNCLSSGTAQGVLIGGNFAIFRNLIGTEYCPDLKGKILFLEDEDEESHNIYMMLTQLRLLKNFHKLKGIVFGNFKGCYPQFKEELDVDGFLKDFAKHCNIPIIKDFENGHIANGYLVPIGKKVKIVSSKKECKMIID